MTRSHLAALFAIFACTAVLGARPQPKPPASPLTPSFRQDRGGWRFVATYKNTGAGEIDLPTLLQASSLELDGHVYARHVVKFGGRSDLHPGESWTFTVEMAQYLVGEIDLAKGRHRIALRLGGEEFGPAEFDWVPIEE